MQIRIFLHSKRFAATLHVFEFEGGGDEAVVALFFRGLAAGDDAAFQIGLATVDEVVAVITGVDAALSAQMGVRLVVGLVTGFEVGVGLLVSLVALVAQCVARIAVAALRIDAFVVAAQFGVAGAAGDAGAAVAHGGLDVCAPLPAFFMAGALRAFDVEIFGDAADATSDEQDGCQQIQQRHKRQVAFAAVR